MYKYHPQKVEKTKYPVKSLAKALRILSTLGQSPSGYSLAHLSRQMGIGKSTIHRLLATMRDEGFVMVDPLTSWYILGVGIARLSEQLNAQSPILKLGAPILEELCRNCSETANLAILEGRNILYLAKQESAEPLRASGQVGRRFPAHATALGKVLLAGLTDEEFRAVFRNISILKPAGPNTIKTVKELVSALKTVRREGVSYDNEEMFPDLCCVAAPVCDFSGKVIAAISLSFLKNRLTKERKEFFRISVKEAGDRLSGRLGNVPAVKNRGKLAAATAA